MERKKIRQKENTFICSHKYAEKNTKKNKMTRKDCYKYRGIPAKRWMNCVKVDIVRTWVITKMTADEEVW